MLMSEKSNLGFCIASTDYYSLQVIKVYRITEPDKKVL